MDYLLVYSNLQQSSGVSAAHGKFIPFGLVILDGELREKGYQGKSLLHESDYQEFIQTKPFVPRLIGITASTWTRFDAIKKIVELKNLFPNALIVAGGYHFGYCPDDSLTNIPELDIVARGEGEEMIIELMEVALGKRPITEVSGISYRDPATKAGSTPPPAIIHQGERRIVKVLKDPRFMIQDFSPADFQNNPLHPEMPIPSFNILAGRGCPYQCIFCSVANVKHRYYPIEGILDVVEHLSKKYQIQGVKFWDDSLTINGDKVRELCEGILRRNLKLFWFCDSRANIDLNLLPLMLKAGCRFFSVGLETGSPRIQKVVGKQVENQMVMNYAARCHELGIRLYIFLMASFPDETPEDLNETVRVAKELCQKYQAVAGKVGVATILPGTRLEEIARERGILPADFSWAKPYHKALNVKYEQATDVPIYIEHITAEMYHEANRTLVSNYASSLPISVFLKESWENLLRKDLRWKEKVRLGRKVLVGRLARMVK